MRNEELGMRNVQMSSEQFRLRKIERALVIYKSVREVKSSNFYGFVKT